MGHEEHKTCRIQDATTLIVVTGSMLLAAYALWVIHDLHVKRISTDVSLTIIVTNVIAGLFGWLVPSRLTQQGRTTQVNTGDVDSVDVSTTEPKPNG